MLRKLVNLWWHLRANSAMSRARRFTLPDGSRQILVICYGNIYRSPLAAERLRARLPASFEVRSGGFHAKAGRASPEAHVAMSRTHGVELAAHRSVTVDAADLDAADLIVLMDRRNWMALSRLGADPAKLLWLGALTPGDVEIRDPYGMASHDAELIVKRILASSDALAERLSRRQ